MTNQGGMWDVTIEDAELEDAIDDWLADAENRSESAKITARRKEMFEKHLSRLKPNQRVRVGRYHFTVGATDRDAYEVGPVHSLGMRKVGTVDEANGA